MICQYNISFDTFHGRVIDPLVYNIIDVIEMHLKNKQRLKEAIYTNIADIAMKYVRKNEFQNMNEYFQNVYYILCFLIEKLYEYGRDPIRLHNPQDYKDYITLKRYYLPLIDLLEEIHNRSEEYNIFAHDYLLNKNGFDTTNTKSVLIIDDIYTPNVKINRILIEDFNKYLKQNQLIFTLTGCLFYKHERKTSLFFKFLSEMKRMRDGYKKLRDENEKDPIKYQFYDMLQNATKTTMNSTYGLYGMSLFRYSNKWLAKTITISGRLALKIAQRIANTYINDLKTRSIKNV